MDPISSICSLYIDSGVNKETLTKKRLLEPFDNIVKNKQHDILETEASSHHFPSPFPRRMTFALLKNTQDLKDIY